ncbi:MAG: DUF4231 domain-containing protein [Candidatus Kapabacteria bacterium]|nr:DUF4231 domain-containing protein [Candidatus Kapabacteria bacterium]
MEFKIEDYLIDRVEDQFSYFDRNAMKFKFYFTLSKKISIICNVLTTLSIGVTFTVSESYKVCFGIISLILSTIVLATYQWEEFHNYGAKWEKYRLVAEQIKCEKNLFLARTGDYLLLLNDMAEKEFVRKFEKLIKGTDLSYFTLMVDPGKRIEKRLENSES